MAHSTWHVYGSILVYMGFLCQNVIAGEFKGSWDQNHPLVKMDTKVHVDAGADDCYFQYIQEGATFYVSFQVIRGGNGMIGFAVQHPDGRIVHSYKESDTSSYAEDKSTGGYYNFCLYNLQSFAHKLVNIYISSLKIEGWQKFQEEITQLHLSIKNFTEIINTVEMNVDTMNQFQSHRRSLESRDMALLTDNNSYVQNWSIAQIVLTILTCTLQVYCVKKLFDIKIGNYKGPI